MNSITGSRTTSTFLEFHASSKSDETAVITETNAGVRQWFTWAELDELVNKTGNWLLQQGLTHADAIALHLPNSLELFLAWLAAGKTGTVAVPVDPGSTVNELRYIVAHSEARLVITQVSTLDAARAACEGCSMVRRLVATSLAEPFAASALGGEINSQPSARPPCEVLPLNVAGLLYTSGTTGRPKGVMLTHAAYLYGAEVFVRSTALTPRDRHLIVLPLHHAAAQCHAMVPSLVAGASTVIVERFSASRFLQQAIRYGATRAALFAAPIRLLLKRYAGLPVPRTRLQLATFAQNLTPEELEEWNTRFGIPLLQLWGMTETVGLPLMVPLNGPRDNMCMGLPAAGYEVKVVDEAGREVRAGLPGEIVVRADPGRNVTRGYFKNPEATAELIRDGWLYSGDRAIRDESGQFHFLGRFKEMIKRGGENISPLEVEDVLKTHPAVQEAVVVGLPDPLRDERVVAFVAFRKGRAAGWDELRKWCCRSLSPFKVPEQFVLCDDFPRTSVGKIQRHVLRGRFMDQGTAAG
jgi:crotonobetaine/carnitine-CoA ligase